MYSGQSLGIRDGDEVAVLVGCLPARAETSGPGSMAVTVGVAQAKYMVLRVSW